MAEYSISLTITMKDKMVKTTRYDLLDCSKIYSTLQDKGG